MKVFLIGGAPNTGKTNAISMCANYLTGRGFSVCDCRDYNGKSIALPKVVGGTKYAKDFLARLEGKDVNNNTVSVILTSASDMTGIIDCNFNYLQGNTCDIFISSIRDLGYERRYMLNKFQLNKDGGNFLEFPLAKMSRRNQKWYIAKNWYDAAVQKMLCHLLQSSPFEL